MNHFIMSPYLICAKDGEFNNSMESMSYYRDILLFAKKYLNLSMLIHSNSLFLNLNAYCPPLEDQSLSAFYSSNILPLLLQLLNNASIVSSLSFPDKYELSPENDNINDDELQMICCSIDETKEKDYLFFTSPESISQDKYYITINDSNYLLYSLSNPFENEEANIINEIVNTSIENETCIFPNIELCNIFISKTKSEKTSACYKKYGDIIAKRNGYKKISYDSNLYKSNAPKYISPNKKYFISLDDVHGTFEVFDAQTKDVRYIGEYGFDGIKVINKTSKKETHKFYA